ncbi:MAG: carboxypeptidase regulatory-like domain-containing protein, partial [Bacteroidetes bacterium]|nr:carboxypeptidase regulatory-like domain-containing protein [Bacteroidota bacterium]
MKSRFSVLFRCALLFWAVLAMVPAQDAQARQDRFDVTGAVVDSAGVGLQGATVVALTAADSTLTKFATANAEGAFTLRRVPEGEYVLQITFVGFRTIQHNFTLAGSDAALGTFAMEIQTEELDELVV